MTTSSTEVLDAIRRCERESAEGLEAAHIEAAVLIDAARDAARETISRARQQAQAQAAARADGLIAAAREDASRIEAGAAERLDQLRSNADRYHNDAVTAMVDLIAPVELEEEE